MSNIANQLIAVVATILGFVAHDALTQRNEPANVVAGLTQPSIDPVVTRAISLEGLSADWLGETPRAEREAQPRPLIRFSDAASAPQVNPRHVEPEFAGVRVNNARIAAPGAHNDTFIR